MLAEASLAVTASLLITTPLTIATIASPTARPSAFDEFAFH